MTGKKKTNVLKGAWQSAVSKHSRYSVVDLGVDLLTGGLDNMSDEAKAHQHFQELMQPRPKGSGKHRK